MKQFGIKTKLILGFGLVACLCLAIGLVGLYGAKQLTKNIKETGEIDMPALHAVLRLKEAQTSIEVLIKALQDSSLSLPKRQELYNNLENKFKVAEKEIQFYGSFSLLDKEKLLWKKFSSKWLQFSEDIGQYIKLNKEIDALKIPDPQKIAFDIEYHFSNYKTWASQAAQDILSQNPESSMNIILSESGFYTWLDGTSFENQDAQEAAKQLRNQLKTVYSSVEELVDLLGIEEFDLAKDVYVAEIHPTIEGIQVYVNKLYELIDLALEKYNRMQTFERQKISISLANSDTILSEIVNNTNRKAEEKYHASNRLASNVALLIIGVIALGVLCALALAFSLIRAITSPIKQTMKMIHEMEEGHLDMRLNMAQSDEIGQMAKSMDSFADTLQHEVVYALAKLSVGDLTFEVVPKNENDAIGNALKKTGDDLNVLILEIRAVAEQMAIGSSQVSDSSQALSHGATEQAASLEQVTSSMSVMASRTKTSAENAALANQLSARSSDVAKKGNSQMKEMMVAMNEINESGQNISKIIKVIDEIAFQTNLLALNAAVEAARAGRHGKGFAVVAEEVRNLAVRSAKAAQQTAELVEGSVEKTKSGTEIANKTTEALEEIVAGVRKVSDLVGEIARDSNEQAEGISQINNGLAHIDQVTQQNTASAEEGAAAAEELSSQASQLKAMLTSFKTIEVGVSGQDNFCANESPLP